MNINDEEFQRKIKELCDNNWKAKAILQNNNNDFRKLPKHQQRLFLKAMGIEKVEVTISQNSV